MNREVLFRGKTKDTGAWIMGQYLVINPIDKPEKYRKPMHVILPSNADVNWYNKVFLKAWEVIPESVGQYMGVDDRDGIKLFEKDVVEARFIGDEPDEMPHILQIEFADGIWWFREGDTKYSRDLVRDIYFIGRIPVDKEEQ